MVSKKVVSEKVDRSFKALGAAGALAIAPVVALSVRNRCPSAFPYGSDPIVYGAAATTTAFALKEVLKPLIEAREGEGPEDINVRTIHNSPLEEDGEKRYIFNRIEEEYPPRNASLRLLDQTASAATVYMGLAGLKLIRIKCAKGILPEIPGIASAEQVNSVALQAASLGAIALGSVKIVEEVKNANQERKNRVGCDEGNVYCDGCC